MSPSNTVAEDDDLGVRSGPIERGIVLDRGWRGGGQVCGGSCNIDWIRNLSCWRGSRISGSQTKLSVRGATKERRLLWRIARRQVDIVLGDQGQVGFQQNIADNRSSNGGTDEIAVLNYECEEVDMDVETDVEGPGAEEGNGWLNFLLFAGITAADRVLVELQWSSVVADMLEPILSMVDWTLMWRMTAGFRSWHSP
ncbi:hypothetical protein B0H14DRAFT_2618182 [Mycena olivaceomarginata]|nr:hypothetical protein B0H14DRAFT_2618182 [Mycena olivaceomarginata]